MSRLGRGTKRVIRRMGSTLMLTATILSMHFTNSHIVLAQYSSTNYKFEEAQIGTGSDNDLSSNNYKAQANAGALGVGNINSTNYRAFGGFLTPNEPFLEIVVNTSLVDLGDLDFNTTKTGNATFSIRAYIDSGYTVISMGDPPTYSGATINPLSSPTAATAGQEQFGINLVANTSPTTFGAAPVMQPDSTFAFGQAATGYNTANLFKYVKGDTIASSSSNGWGKADYTISYIANISALTEAGQYTTNQDLVAIPTF